MTENPAGPGAGPAEAPPPPDPPPPPTPLFRPRQGRVFRGVCAGLARATGTDPVLWRVLVVVLAVLGGSGIVLYLAGWLLLPDEGAAESTGQRLARGGLSTPATVGIVALGVVVVLIALDDGRGIATLAVVGVLAWLVVRSRQEPAAAGVGWSSPPAWTAPPPAAGWTPPPAPGWTAAPPPPPAPRPPRPRSPLGLITVSAVLVAVAGMLLAAGLGVDGVTVTRVLAVALLVTGVGLLVGTVWGRSRSLIALAVVLGLALSASTAVDRTFDSSAGERTWVVDGSTERALGAGSATLDLRPLAGTERRDLTVEGRVGLGELVVLVPEDLRVDLDAEVGLGEVSLVEPNGAVRRLDGGDQDLEEDLGPAGARNVRLEVRVGLGELEVRRVPTAD